MAVQAQYPSNILLLNRNAPEVKDMLAGDYPLQAQASGYLDQPAMLFPNGAAPSNSRKRNREANASSLSPINLFSLQSKPAPPTLVSLAQLHNQPQPCLVSTGLGLSLQDQPQEQQQQQNGQLGHLKSSSLISTFLTEDLATHIKQQTEEIDQFLQAQGDQLRRQLAERRERHYRALLGAAEESALQRLRQKEAEVERAARRRAELEERMGRLEVEAQAWRARARAQEAAAATLQAQLQQAMMTARSSGPQDKGEEIGCSAEDAESAHVDPDRVEVVAGAGPKCRACRRRCVSAVLIPCRHLCVCAECDSVVRACPICRVPRSGSVQVYLT